MEQLSNNDFGLVLLILGIFFMLAEAMVYAFGIFALIGAIIFLFGINLLLVAGQHYVAIDCFFIFLVFIGVLAIVIACLRLTYKALKRPVVTGAEGLEHEIGVVIADFDEQRYGYVHIHGEVWQAISEEALHIGDKVNVVSKDGLVLRVKKREVMNNV